MIIEFKILWEVSVKILCIILFLLLNNLSVAQEVQLYSFDEYDTEWNEYGYSEDELLQEIDLEMDSSSLMRFTPISISRANSLFNTLKRNSRARQRYPNGYCSHRRVYIQNYLRRLGIYSGRLYINCPERRGRLRLRDQVSGRYYTFINFHDTNVVLVKTSSGNFYRIMDIQYQSGPRQLGPYLAQIERYQRLRRAKSYDSAGICYWRITSPGLVEEMKGEFYPREAY